MMKTYPKPLLFDGAKFGLRYGLDPRSGTFWADEKFIYVPDNLPDDPPIFEGPDPRPPFKSIEARLKDLEAKTANLPIPPVSPVGGPN